MGRPTRSSEQENPLEKYRSRLREETDCYGVELALGPRALSALPKAMAPPSRPMPTTSFFRCSAFKPNPKRFMIGGTVDRRCPAGQSGHSDQFTDTHAEGDVEQLLDLLAPLEGQQGISILNK